MKSDEAGTTASYAVRPLSNAIVVLGGPGPRVPKWLALAHGGYANYLVISDLIAPIAPVSWRPVRVICFVPHLYKTQGEARNVSKLAREHHWDPAHCGADYSTDHPGPDPIRPPYHGTLLFNPASSWWHDVVYEWDALAQVFTLQRGC